MNPKLEEVKPNFLENFKDENFKGARLVSRTVNNFFRNLRINKSKNNEKSLKPGYSGWGNFVYLDLENTSFDGFMNWILTLRKELEIPHTLKELINDDSKFEKMSKMALQDPSTNGNPVELSESDFLTLYQDSYEGNL